jgi:hypothetical protein
MSDDVNIRISATDNATPTLQKIQAQMATFQGAVSSIAGLSLAGVGIQQVGAFLGDSLKAYAEAERTGVMLERVLRTTGNTVRMTRAEIQAYADERKAETVFDDDAIVEAASHLARFRNIAGEMFTGTLSDAQDLATVMGTDIVSATQMLGRAYSNPVDGMSKLRRAGVMFTDEQEQQIKNAQELGRITEAQAIMQSEVRRQFGGAAREDAGTTSGQLKQLERDLGDIKEGIGRFLAPDVAMAANISRAIQGQSVNGDATRVARMFLQPVEDERRAKALQDQVAKQISDSFTAATGMFSQLAMQRAGANAAGLAGGAAMSNIGSFFGAVAANDAGTFAMQKLFGIVADQKPDQEQERMQSLQATESRFLTRGRGQLSPEAKKQAEDNAKQLAELKAIKDVLKNLGENMLVVEGIA